MNVQQIFGWSSLTWWKAFTNLNFDKSEVKTVLEIGAGPYLNLGLCSLQLT